MVMTGEQIQYAVIAIVFIAMVIIVVRNLKKSKKKDAGCSSCPYSLAKRSSRSRAPS